MAPALTAAQARALLARSQRLAGPARDDGAAVADVVRAAAGLQAQDAHAASLGVRARLAGSSASAVERARVEERSIVRVPCMRGTLHLVAADDVHWLLALLGPVALARARGRHEPLGVSSPEARAAVRAALADRGPLTRQELAAEVRARGVRLADDPQTPTHLVGRAAMAGEVCEAARKGGRPAYVLAEDWLGPAPPPPERDAALAELARRHAAACAPATPEDLASWAGLPLRDARRGFAAVAGELREVRVGERPAWVPRRAELAAGAPEVRLLPAFDGLLLAHRDRSLVVRPEHARAVAPGGGMLAATVLVGGLVEGTWRLARGAPQVSTFAPPGAALAAALEREAADVVRHRGA